RRVVRQPVLVHPRQVLVGEAAAGADDAGEVLALLVGLDQPLADDLERHLQVQLPVVGAEDEAQRAGAAHVLDLVPLRQDVAALVGRALDGGGHHPAPRERGGAVAGGIAEPMPAALTHLRVVGDEAPAPVTKHSWVPYPWAGQLIPRGLREKSAAPPAAVTRPACTTGRSTRSPPRPARYWKALELLRGRPGSPGRRPAERCGPRAGR